jgi:general secretion pathway protein J
MVSVPKTKRVGGFTLLELLVAMTLFAVMALLVFDGLRLGIRSWQAVDVHTERSEELRLVLGFLRSQLGQARGLIYTDAERRQHLSFVGEAGRLSWVAPFPGYLPQAGLYWFTLETVRVGSRRQLRLEYEVFDPQGDHHATDGDRAPIVLHDDMEAVEFAYLDRDPVADRAHWESHWERSDRLPSLIRLRFSPGDAEARAWPELLVAPRLSPSRGGR